MPCEGNTDLPPAVARELPSRAASTVQLRPDHKLLGDTEHFEKLAEGGASD